jgi:F-type H+-transporting ATPase subunit epsilon
MASTFSFSLVTPGEVKFEGSAEIVVAPGMAGDLAALANHAPMLTTLRAGVVRATVGGDGASAERRVEFAVDGGFMQLLPDRVLVLADRALSVAEIDADAARRELEHAEAEAAGKQGDDGDTARRAIAWARARLEVTRTPPV